MKNFFKISLSLGVVLLGLGCIWVFASSSFSGQDHPPIKQAAAAPFNEVIPAANPAEGDLIGTLTIPALERQLDIYQGTGDRELGMGVGHFTQSVLPGIKDNCVLSGHNDSVFTKLDHLEIGDLLIIQTPVEKFTYQVVETRIVDKDDKTVIVPTKEATLTLTTCYPFMAIGPAPERYIIIARLLHDL